MGQTKQFESINSCSRLLAAHVVAFLCVYCTFLFSVCFVKRKAHLEVCNVIIYALFIFAFTHGWTDAEECFTFVKHLAWGQTSTPCVNLFKSLNPQENNL